VKQLNYKIAYLLLIATLFLLACSNNTNRGIPKNSIEKTVNASPSINGKSYLTAEIEGNTFTANTDVYATEIAGKYVIGGENDDFALNFELPVNVTIGAVIVEANVSVKKPFPKLYNAGLAAATVQKLEDNAISGTFTFLAKTANEELLQVKNGKFLVLRNKK
jgi:hypothetical protein